MWCNPFLFTLSTLLKTKHFIQAKFEFEPVNWLRHTQHNIKTLCCLLHIHHSSDLFLLWGKGTNASTDPEALCNIQVHTLTWQQMSDFSKKDLCFLFKNLKYTKSAHMDQCESLPSFGSLHHSLQWLLFNINVHQILQKCPSWQHTASCETSLCLFCTQTTHFKSPSSAGLRLQIYISKRKKTA